MFPVIQPLIGVMLYLMGTVWAPSHVCLTHAGLYQQEVAVALQQWGETSAIRDCGVASADTADIVLIPAAPGVPGGAALPVCSRNLHSCELGQFTTYCQITVSSQVQPDYIQRLVTHEVGHCLGLDHDPDPTSIMFAGVATTEPNAYDRFVIGYLYPRFRVTIAL